MAWEIDKAHSEISFRVRHMMVSNVRGQFESFSGTVDADEENPENSSVYVEIDAASINTRQADRDAHLRSPDFLDVENYPTITFKSTRVEQTGENTGKLHGDLTIRGVTKPVTLDVEYHGQAPSPLGPMITAGFSATTKINRKDWGLAWNVPIETGGVLVGEQVQIDIEVELIKQVEEASASNA